MQISLRSLLFEKYIENHMQKSLRNLLNHNKYVSLRNSKAKKLVNNKYY